MQNQCILFSFSQGSTATYLRRGGMYFMIVVENFFLFQTVKESDKSVKI